MVTDPYESYTFNGLTLDVRTGVYGPADKHAVQEVQEYPLPDDVRTVIDAGAHIGAFTCWVKHKFPDVEVAAIEPNKDNYQLMFKNTVYFATVHPYYAALTDDVDIPYTFSTDPINSGGHRLVESFDASTPRVPFFLYTLEQIMNNHFGDLDILKMDIEGREVHVLLNARAHILRRIHWIVGERHVTHENFLPVIRRLEILGFSVEDKPHPELSVPPWNMADRGLFKAVNQNWKRV